MVTCPFHKEVLRQLLFGLADKAPTFIDEKFGRVHTNANEVGFAAVWRSKMKGETISHDCARVVFARGNLDGNQTAMENMQGECI